MTKEKKSTARRPSFLKRVFNGIAGILSKSKKTVQTVVEEEKTTSFREKKTVARVYGVKTGSPEYFPRRRKLKGWQKQKSTFNKRRS